MILSRGRAKSSFATLEGRRRKAAMKVLFDLRDHPDHGLVRVTNEQLAAAGEEYLERYGKVGSDQWWHLYDRQRISRSELAGDVIHVGSSQDDFGEACDIVRIRTDCGIIEYDREGFWADVDVQPGRWIHIERVKTCVETRTGPVTTILDVRVWVEGAVQQQAAGDGARRRA
jgi:hypothetical protein